jgi:hypothetical protein
VGAVPGKPPGVSVSLKSRDTSALVVTVSWTADASATGYSVTASGGFTGGNQSALVTGTSTDLTIPCGGSAFCASGRLDVSVTAQNAAGAGTAGVASWSVPPAATPPPPVPTTTTTTPPPPSLPTAGAVVITTITGNVGAYIKRVNMTPPADWANHNGTCEVVNTTYGYSTPIACSATSASIEADIGTNRIVVRAHAATGGASVDSASKNTTVRDPETCGTKPCQIPRNEAPVAPMGAGGLGLLTVAALLRVGRRRHSEETR